MVRMEQVKGFSAKASFLMACNMSLCSLLYPKPSYSCTILVLRRDLLAASDPEDAMGLREQGTYRKRWDNFTGWSYNYK